jgi:tRNA threonylcarbamoyladenosine biosynthesis protein TsaE
MTGVHVSRSPEETRAIGRAIGEALEAGEVVLLHGDLGAGKTELTKGIAAGLGVPTTVQSPTFTLVMEHPAPRLGEGARLLHLDLYRLDAADLDEIGWDDLVASDDVLVVEWPERARDRLPVTYLLVEIEHAGPDARTVRISRHPEERAA